MVQNKKINTNAQVPPDKSCATKTTSGSTQGGTAALSPKSNKKRGFRPPKTITPNQGEFTQSCDAPNAHVAPAKPCATSKTTSGSTQDGTVACSPKSHNEHLPNVVDLASDSCNFLEIVGSVPIHIFQKQGSLKVQHFLENGSKHEIFQICEELHGRVADASFDKHANYVIQKAVEVLPADMTRFFFCELSQFIRDACRDEIACRIVQRLVEHHAGFYGFDPFINYILAEAGDLSCDTYGHLVVESILEHGNPVQQQSIVDVMKQDIHGYSQDMNASYVVIAALRLKVSFGREIDEAFHRQTQEGQSLNSFKMTTSGKYVEYELRKRRMMWAKNVFAY